MENVTLITSDKNWLEQKAVDQLKQVAALPGIRRVIGLPDLHPGKTPVGAVFITEGIIYPHLIGNDIGCGMSVFLTDLEKKNIKMARLVKRLEDFKSLDEVDWTVSYSLSYPNAANLGTIGGGNHFAELQEVENIYDIDTFNRLGFDKNRAVVLVHSGSRGYGQMISDEFIRNHQAQHGLQEGSEAFGQYLFKHDEAVRWASENRKRIASRFLKAMGVKPNGLQLLNSTHNSISIKNIVGRNGFIHRKGAAPADQGAVVIPGSRGSLTYLVMPSGDDSVSGYSLAHGAGRKWERQLCKSRLEGKYTKESIRSTRLKGRVVCHDLQLLYQEAPESYKNIDIIIQILADAGLLQVVATLKPVITYKN